VTLENIEMVVALIIGLIALFYLYMRERRDDMAKTQLRRGSMKPLTTVDPIEFRPKVRLPRRSSSDDPAA
jgi:hypothetical protein